MLIIGLAYSAPIITKSIHIPTVRLGYSGYGGYGAYGGYGHSGGYGWWKIWIILNFVHWYYIFVIHLFVILKRVFNDM